MAMDVDLDKMDGFLLSDFKSPFELEWLWY
jgi:hypothetical protein